jgi:hypothetical protein
LFRDKQAKVGVPRLEMVLGVLSAIVVHSLMLFYYLGEVSSKERCLSIVR